MSAEITTADRPWATCGRGAWRPPTGARVPRDLGGAGDGGALSRRRGAGLALHRAAGPRLARGVGLALLAAGCRAEPPHEFDCTAMSGAPVLRVVVADPPVADSVRVAAVAVGTAPRAEEARFDSAAGGCAGTGCAAGVVLAGFAPDTAVVTLAVRDRRTRHAVVPRYTLWYPNGPRCDPAIRSGRVVIVAP